MEKTVKILKKPITATLIAIFCGFLVATVILAASGYNPFEAFGALLGGRDHSTIIHGIKKITEEYQNDENFHHLIETIKKKINPN